MWKKALHRAKVDYFHATDFYACHEEFSGWKKGSRRHRDTEDEFTSIADSAGLAGFAVGFETAAYDDELKSSIQNRNRSTVFAPAADMCADGFTGYCRPLALTPLSPEERVTVVLRQQGIGEVVDYFTRRRRVALTKRLSVAPGDKVPLRPLQIADLLAHLVFNDVTLDVVATVRQITTVLGRMFDAATYGADYDRCGGEARATGNSGVLDRKRVSRGRSARVTFGTVMANTTSAGQR
jgi:hypothetical protein